MAATNWALYTQAKKKLGNGTIQLGVHALYIALYKAASNASTSAPILSTKASVTNEVTNGNGYATHGQALTSVTWTVSGSNCVLDAANPLWTATGGALTSISFGVIYASAGASAGTGNLLCRSLLTTSTSVSSGNTITVNMATAGIFALT
jgi:hypothetical protein